MDSTNDFVGRRNGRAELGKDEKVERKRRREAEIVSQMIALRCHALHGSRDGLCDECADLLDYALARIARCPHMATKTFCSQCPTHCYAPARAEQIREVMRWAGPRMLLHHPVMAIHHALETMAAAWRARRAQAS